MSDSKSNPGRPKSGHPDPGRAHRHPGPPNALDALLAEPAGDPIRRALRLEDLDRRLRPLLPPSLAAHARLANYEQGRLVLLVEAPVWRARLRLAAPEILDAARSIGLAATELVVKTRLGSAAPSPPAPRPDIPMSTASQQALKAALASLRDPEPTPRRGRSASGKASPPAVDPTAERDPGVSDE